MKIQIAIAAALIGAATTSTYQAVQANQKVGELEQRNQQWSQSYEYLATERARLDAEATRWKQRNQASAREYEARIRALGRYKTIADAGSKGGAACVDAAVPDAIADLMRQQRAPD